MGRSIDIWRGRVRTLLGAPPESLIAHPDIDLHVEAAVRRFSADRARVLSADYPGDGVAFDLALAALISAGTWVHGFSTPQGVEYPAGQREPIFLDEQDWFAYPQTSAPTAIRLRSTTPATGKTARLYFTSPWPIPGAAPATDVISDVDFEPVACLAAAFAAYQLAGKTAQTVDSTIESAAGIDFGGGDTRWREVARDRLKTYKDHVGGGANDGAPAGGTTDWDALSSFIATGRLFLTRPRRR